MNAKSTTRPACLLHGTSYRPRVCSECAQSAPRPVEARPAFAEAIPYVPGLAAGKRTRPETAIAILFPTDR